MSTQINVIVDNGGLSEKARRQTQSNRWSKLESDNRQKVEATGTKQRDANRAQQGIGPDGRPLYGTPASQPLRRDEPAAFRPMGLYKALLQPNNITSAGNELRFDVQVKGGTAFAVQSQTRHKATYNEISFSGTGLLYYNDLTTINTADIIERLPTGGPKPSQPALRFKKWPAVLNKGTYKSPIDSYISLHDSAGALTRKPAGKKPPGDFTLEVYFQLTESTISVDREYSVYRELGIVIYDATQANTSVGEDGFSGSPRYKDFAKILVYPPYVSGSGNINNRGIAIYEWTDDDGNQQQSPEIVVANVGQWHHYALCRKSGQVSAYLDGARMSGPHATTYQATSDGLDLYLYCMTDQAVDYGIGGLPLYTPDAARVSNALFTTKALYDGPFTPAYLTP